MGREERQGREEDWRDKGVKGKENAGRKKENGFHFILCFIFYCCYLLCVLLKCIKVVMLNSAITKINQKTQFLSVLNYLNVLLKHILSLCIFFQHSIE